MIRIKIQDLNLHLQNKKKCTIQGEAMHPPLLMPNTNYLVSGLNDKITCDEFSNVYEGYLIG